MRAGVGWENGRAEGWLHHHEEGLAAPRGLWRLSHPETPQMPTTFETPPHVANSHFLGGSELVRVSSWGLHALGSALVGLGLWSG